MDWPELTADQAAEFLEKNLGVVSKFLPDREWIANWIEIHVYKDTHFGKLWFVKAVYGGNDAINKTLGKGVTPTAALNAAAQAVKERGKECPTTKR